MYVPAYSIPYIFQLNWCNDWKWGGGGGGELGRLYWGHAGKALLPIRSYISDYLSLH